MRSSHRTLVVSLLAFVLVLMAVPTETSASPFKIQGYLKDEKGLPIPRANISLSGELYDYMTDVYTPTTIYTETDMNGYYVQYVWGWDEPGGFPLNSDITISYNSGDKVVSTTVNVAGTGAWGNLTYKEPVSILDTVTSPLFLIVLVVIVVSSIMVGHYIIRQDKDEDVTEEDAPKRVERRRGGK